MTLQLFLMKGCCNRKCNVGDGDCSSSTHCVGDATCGTSNCYREGLYDWDSSDDCCML